MQQAPFKLLGLKFGGKRKFPILKQMSGILKPVGFGSAAICHYEMLLTAGRKFQIDVWAAHKWPLDTIRLCCASQCKNAVNAVLLDASVC